MRCINVIASFALALAGALPASAQTPSANWPADPKTGCKVWSQSPAEGETITWSGGCASGLAQGRGVVEWFTKGKLYERDEGEYRNGKLNGRGTIVFANGNRYDGEFRDGLYHGQGTYSWANGDRYQGAWQNDRVNGTGTKTTANGQTFSGNWTNGCFKQGDRWSTVGVTPKECGFK